MIHEDYLAALLRPLGVYDLRAGTVNRGELGAYGKELDGMGQGLEDTARAAMAAGAIAMESAETINPDMSARLLRRRAGFGEGVETP